MALTHKPVDASDEATIGAYHGVAAAARAADLPDMPPLLRDQATAQIRYPRPATTTRHFVAQCEGEPIATLCVNMPMADNRHTADVEIVVHPHRRRRGVGRELFHLAVGLAREQGRRLLMGNYCEALPGGPDRSPGPAAFARAMGAAPALSEVRRRLDLGIAETAAWPALRDDARSAAEGYSLLWWPGAVPEQFLADVAYLESRMVMDAPMGELDYEPENYDAERIRAADQVHRLRGEAIYHAAARDNRTGRIVGWTALGFDVGDGTHAWQGTTIVDPEHRGHRLGLGLKLENLLRTREVERELRTVDTWNAAQNSHMIAINEAVGFRPLDAWVNWQFAVPA